MKKVLSIFLSLLLIFSLFACGNNEANIEENVPSGDISHETDPVSPDSSVEEEQEPEEKPEETPSEKPAEKPAEKPQQKPVTVPEQKPQQKPEQAPQQKPEETPSEKPAEKPSETNNTVGKTMRALFLENSSKSAEQIATAIVESGKLPFMAMTAPVEEGYLTGFDNTEIKGFSSATMFAPGIGTIPFVGYVFELPSGADSAAFVKLLRDNANLAWNICTEAEELVVESRDGKVFFVMCPTNFEE